MSLREIDPDKLKRNLDLAIDAYINSVNGCPCGTTTTQLYKGEHSSEYTASRPGKINHLFERFKIA